MNPLRNRQSLNGWWDFLPVLTPEAKKHVPLGPVPREGWLSGAILVPGSWTRGHCVGEDNPDRPWDAWRIFDSYGYPAEWDGTATAWYRRSFRAPSLAAGQRLWLEFGGITRLGYVLVNGQLVGSAWDSLMPSEYDITDVLRPGDNELVVYVTDYQRNDKGKTWVTHGSDQMSLQMGIWQDVYLSIRPELYVSDVIIRTSTRRNELTVMVEVSNKSSRPRTVAAGFGVSEANAHVDELSFAAGEVTVPAGGKATIETVQPWSAYHPWSPWSPQLYLLTTTLREAGAVADMHQERFGFREVWLEEHRMMLNGQPVHMSGDWCHKMNFDNYRPEYIRQWYGMIKDANMNYIRTHMMPHPKLLLDIADEMGILVCVEAAWFFGSGYALDDEELWQNSLQHVRNHVGRDKNHPSVVLWSVGNEVRWSGNQPAIIKNVPRLRELYEKLDPTRIAYHDGDSSLWDERSQALLSRHYGLECAGEGWWDRSQPLHVGEMGKWHFGQPIDNAVWGDDDIFASFRLCHKAVAVEAADIIEQARSNEVLALFPWNLSGLDNYRPWPQEHKFEWPDPSAPGVKPLRSAPYGSEFAWWEPNSKGYVPGVSFDIIKHAFRPVALVVRERLNAVFDDQPIRHTVTVVNDSGGAVTGTLRVRLLASEKVVWESAQEVTVAQGCTHRVKFEIQPAGQNWQAEARLETTFGDTARTLDSVVRTIRIVPAARRAGRWDVGPVAVLGAGAVKDVLAAHGVAVRPVGDLDALDAKATPVLLIEKDAVQAGSRQNHQVEKFLRAGGRAVVLEQTASILPQLGMDSKPAERVHIRGGRNDILAGFTARDFEFWGNEPFGLTNSDSWVVVNPYRKPHAGSSRTLIDSGWGDFGHGGLNWAAMLETRVGDGLFIGCQLRVSDKAATHPCAMALLERMLTYVSQWNPRPLTAVSSRGEPARLLAELGVATTAQAANVALVDGSEMDRPAAVALARSVFDGATAVVVGVSAATARELAEAFRVELRTVDLGTIYNLVRVKDDPVLDGISNQETYWLDKAHYGPTDKPNRPITSTLLRCPHGEDLLVSEYDSAWREFYTQDAKSERLRMPVMTYYTWNGPREHAAGMLRIRHGRGQLLLCQVPLPGDGYGKARVFWCTLLRNLGVQATAALTTGESVAPSSKRSDGFPLELSYVANPSDQMLEQMLRIATPQEYRLPNHALRSSFEWKKAPAPNGQIELSENAARVVIMFQVEAGRPRLSVPVEGGLPNPNLQTLLDLYGRGVVRAFINGRAFEPLDLGVEQQATVPDIDLQMEWNSCLLIWQPPQPSSGATLRLAFRNRQRQPEVEFNFLPNC
jgi:hypothetical protein